MNQLPRYALLLATLFSTQYKASARYGRNDYSCPKLYIGISTGIENPSGLIGFNVDVPVTQNFSLGAGVGLSSWGYKAYGEGRFYFGECNRGWALGTGVTYNTGLTNFTTTLPTTAGDQDVALDLNPRTNVFLAGYRFWNLGHNGHRIYLALGYSIRLDEDNYSIRNPYVQLTSDGQQAMKILAPGGFMLGFGFSWGVAR
ncbi:MAG: hypothetical protein BGO70_05120 [Bacteroidetes bacterium 43-93]|nr:hypothetical protein [Bacteroidota bacterium]OJW96785.1 MAG: hypothetical protein BGO70_05120 [Bacteroidetes bacterium 43-93]